MECIDEYSHESPQILYFPRCIPTKEVEETIEPSNVFCTCEDSCSEKTNCRCIQLSGTYYCHTNSDDLENYILTARDKSKPTFECNEQCLCKNILCGNKLVQCGPRKNLIIRSCENPMKGQGVYTERSIKSGNFICEYAGEIISEIEASKRFKKNVELERMNYISCINEHFGDKNLKTFIDPTFYGNIGRYVNHSCDPNCKMVVLRISDNIPVLGLFASKDIDAGDELSYNYGSAKLNGENDNEETGTIKCLCESKVCKEFLPYDKIL